MGQMKYSTLISEIFDNKHPSFRLNYMSVIGKYKPCYYL